MDGGVGGGGSGGSGGSGGWVGGLMDCGSPGMAAGWRRWDHVC